MNIEIIKGDLLDLPNGINVLTHGCNTNNKFGAGLALSIKNKFPYAYEADCLAAQRNINKLGEFSIGFKDKDNPIILNLYTQSLHYNSMAGIPTSYDAAYCAFTKICDWLNKGVEFENKIILGIPHGICSGLGGGEWNIVHEIIKKTLTKAKFKTYIVQYEK